MEVVQDLFYQELNCPQRSFSAQIKQTGLLRLVETGIKQPDIKVNVFFLSHSRHRTSVADAANICFD